jgi:DNA polymerase III subunit gamma/tau
MALDTRYRPLKYADVIGQDASVTILKHFVKSGSGFYQSYLFCGPFGSGKTTLGRILARALLCENPKDGEPCDECPSCRAILETGTSECFSEMDAATKSGKDNILHITEEIQYSTFSGKRRLYLFDEAHQLSKQALDALLKPMEDSIPGSEDKQLVCIFCTTEPERMRATVFSRCAPAFSIRVVTPDLLADRLTWICQQEKIPYERDCLVTIAEATECHIRDAIKTIEGISLLGGVTRENVAQYLRMDANEKILKILALIGSDLKEAMRLAGEVCQVISPTSVYERLAEASMAAYRVYLGVSKPPSYWKPGFVEKLGEHHKEFLISFAQCFSSRPRHPTASMLAMDIARLHQTRLGMAPQVVVTQAVQQPPVQLANPPSLPASPDPPVAPEVPANATQGTVSGTSATPTGKVISEPQGTSTGPIAGLPFETKGGVYIDPRAQKKREQTVGQQEHKSKSSLSASTFRQALQDRIRELREDDEGRGLSGRHKLGGTRTHSGR